jgi:predicted enzyme related to lactoylglutathione lyase
MPAKIKHIAISSDNYPLLGRFYEALFGLTTSGKARPEAAVVLSDGYVGMNINPRPLGCIARLDHFGFEVPDPEEIYKRVREAYPTIGFIRRPANRPFAGLTMHDPAGTYFDLSYPRMDHLQDVYADASLQGQAHARRIHHFQLRVLDAPNVAKFYRDVFDMDELPKDAGDSNYYLTDGVVTMVLTPWRIEEFGGSNAQVQGPDHLGFVVESIDQLRADLERLKNRNYSLHPRPGLGPENESRLELLATCRYGHYQLTDPDGTLLDVIEA